MCCRSVAGYKMRAPSRNTFGNSHLFKPFGKTSAGNVLQDCSTKCSNVIIKTDINSLSDYYYIFQKLIDHIPGMWRSTKYAKVIENEKHQKAYSYTPK